MRSVSRARHLRSASTDAEKVLWRLLRNRQLAGCKFRRQAPIGRYVVDFVCFENQLIVEVDGGQHQARARADAKRTKWLTSQGFRVIRFWSNQVLTETSAVQEVVLEALEDRTSPSP
jgi:very-short-patch-repair endonuclease